MPEPFALLLADGFRVAAAKAQARDDVRAARHLGELANEIAAIEITSPASPTPGPGGAPAAPAAPHARLGGPAAGAAQIEEKVG